MFKLNVNDIDTTGNYVVVVVVLNTKTYGEIVSAFSRPNIIPQFMEYSQDLQLYKFDRRSLFIVELSSLHKAY
jgi:hypothetical protein